MTSPKFGASAKLGWLRVCAFSIALSVHTQPVFTAQVATQTTNATKISDGVVKIGVITDLSSIYKDLAGRGSEVAVRMAIEDFGGKVLGIPIDVITRDHENKPETAGNVARELIERQKVDMVIDVPNSAAALEVVKVANALKKIAVISAAGSARLTNEDCTDTTVHWTFDTVALATVTGKAIIKRGGNSWYFITADYAFGHSLEKDAMHVVTSSGGAVLGTTRHPFPSNTFASLKAQAAGLLQAQASNAKVIALASAGTDATNAIKQARRFGISPKQTLAALLVFDTDVTALGLEDAQDLYLTTGFYWDLDEATRAWSKRFFARHKSMPTMAQAGNYSAVTHYLKAIAAAGTDEASAVMAKMRSNPVQDFFAKNGVLRLDGRMVHDMYLVQVKKPNESKYPGDYMHVREIVPGAEAFRPLAQSQCSFVKRAR
jgi:branched-chain amino acid transport system substrate-binding protein